MPLSLVSERKGSISVEILKDFSSGGAHVGKFPALCGSALTIVPFNQGSKQDVEVLFKFIYTTL